MGPVRRFAALLCMGAGALLLLGADAAPGGAPEQSVVFFIVEGNGEELAHALVPLSCYHAGQHRLAAGRTCLSLSPPDAEVALQGGARVKLRGRAKTGCETVPRTEVLRFSGSPGKAEYAVWPPAQLGRVHSAPGSSPPGPRPVLRKGERRAIEHAVDSRLELHDQLEVHQALDLDLDGDGRRERVFSVEATQKGRRTTNFTALFMGSPEGADLLIQEPVEPAAVDEALVVSGTMDLDGDGRLELWVSAVGTDEHAELVMQYADGALRRVSRWKDCAPP